MHLSRPPHMQYCSWWLIRVMFGEWYRQGTHPAATYCIHDMCVCVCDPVLHISYRKACDRK
jgi:hypothetical protein